MCSLRGTGFSIKNFSLSNLSAMTSSSFRSDIPLILAANMHFIIFGYRPSGVTIEIDMDGAYLQQVFCGV